MCVNLTETFWPIFSRRSEKSNGRKSSNIDVYIQNQLIKSWCTPQNTWIVKYVNINSSMTFKSRDSKNTYNHIKSPIVWKLIISSKVNVWDELFFLWRYFHWHFVQISSEWREQIEGFKFSLSGRSSQVFELNKSQKTIPLQKKIRKW